MTVGSPEVVAIDGPAGVGKTTVARQLAADLGWAHLDSGALYRAVTWMALDRGLDPSQPEALARAATDLDLRQTPEGRTWVDGADQTEVLRQAWVTAAVPRVAALPVVRRVMVAHQRRFAAENRRVVAEGRDMGTVVFPDAAVKIYLDADPAERARRRYRQDRSTAADLGDSEREGLETVLSDIEDRDRRDRSRPVAPLIPAPDAWRLDTTRMTLDEVFEAVRSHVRSRIPVESERESEA